ncbi:ABC transporter ATP-binding protein/permease [Eggerthellaceae bacterium zg-1084]|uniref:ABC transporter ATP-binding protein/permease n=1 Tax=Berryella wangjianweii TaxID=2734634 RepID=UPI001556EA3B|nr:ABC transporter ATP-binding protein/permease [Berryella wangjianweii]NPD31320.1 ABC transporter ATP-binding protein/permease [Berryella wangjianweii]NPD32371.1 ABC transporter ATP-binding protein/permease [Eggerthellaceae bacterium zg-997]
MMDKRLLSLVPEAMRHVLATVGWQWFGLLANIALVWGVVDVLVSAAAQGMDAVVRNLPLIALALAGKVAASILSQRSSFRASERIKFVLREKIYRKLMRLGPSYTEHVATAEVVQVSVEGTEQLETYFGQFLPQLFYAAAAPLTLFVVVLPLSWQAAVVLLVFVPLIPLTIMMVQKIAARLLSKYWDQYTQLGDGFLENLQGLTTLKVYGADAARHERMNADAEHFRVITMKVLRMQLNSIVIMDAVALGGAAAGIGVALFQWADGALPWASFLLIVLLSAEFFLPMRTLGSFFHIAMNGMAASKKIFRLLAAPEPPARTAEARPGDAVTLDHVSFGYDDERTVLHDVSLSVPRTGLVAVVGASGSGKSTVAHLMAGGSERYRGDVLIGANQVRDISEDSLARHMTTVRIGSYLFAGTVRSNLAMANPQAGDEQMWAALDSAALSDFLRGQQGLDTPIDDEGANLSGGQRQRLALARALLHDSDLYVFDEATSNIDVESEERIMDVVAALAQVKAVVVISHRLANVVGADCIHVLEQGRLVGSGTHEQLLDSCSAYERLWSSQRALEQYRGGDRHEAR